MSHAFAVALCTVISVMPATSIAVAQSTTQAVDLAVPSIRTTLAERRELVQTLSVNGTITPRQEAAVGVDVQGLIVRELLAESGDRVERGQVLARLDRTALETQLAQIQASAAQVEASVAQAGAQVQEADVGVRQAREALDRARTLQERGVAAKAQLDNAVNGYDSAVARRESAARAVTAAEAQRAVVAAQQRDVEERLAKTEVLAPVGGLVLARNATLGAVVSAGSGPLFRIAVDGELELAATVSETVIPTLEENMPVVLHVSGLTGVKGSIRRIDPEIDMRTRLATIRISIEPTTAVRSGNFARGDIETLRREGVAVPASALIYRGSEAFLQRVEDGTIRTVRVVTGARADGDVEIVEGISDGDEIVSRAGTFVTDGDKVRPVRDPEAVSAAQVKTP